VTLFGFSGGANIVIRVAVGGAPAAAGALAGAGSSVPESLVILDPDYLVADPGWGDLVSIDPSFMTVWSPFSYLGHAVDFPVTVICSGDPGSPTPITTMWARTTWEACSTSRYRTRGSSASGLRTTAESPVQAVPGVRIFLCDEQRQSPPSRARLEAGSKGGVEAAFRNPLLCPISDAEVRSPPPRDYS